MSYYEKPKRQTQAENEFAQIARHFYFPLFVYLMIPALLLGCILGLPAILLSNLPDLSIAQCSVFDGNVGVRIISETQRSNITNYYWSDDRGDSWQLVYSTERSYRTATADCTQIRFSDNSINITIDSEEFILSNEGTIISH